MRFLALAVLIAIACSSQYAQQPRPQPVGTVIADVESEYEIRTLEYHARELCALEMQWTSDVMVEAGNSLRDSREFTEPLCERPEVLAPFVRVLRSGVDEQLRTARDEASDAAKRPFAPRGQEGPREHD